MLRKVIQFTRITNVGQSPQPMEFMEVGGRNPQSRGIFCNLKKYRCFNALCVKFRSFLELFERTKLLRFGKLNKSEIT